MQSLKPLLTEKQYNALKNERVIPIVGTEMSGKTLLLSKIYDNSTKNRLFVKRIGISEIHSISVLMPKLYAKEKAWKLFLELMQSICPKCEFVASEYVIKVIYAGKECNMNTMSSNIAAAIYISISIVENLQSIASDNLSRFCGTLLIDNFDGVFSSETIAANFIKTIKEKTEIIMFVVGYKQHVINSDVSIHAIEMKDNCLYAVGSRLSS